MIIINQLAEEISAIKNEKTLDGLIKILERNTKLLGFDYFSYGGYENTSYGEPKIKFFNNYPKEWKDTYIDNKFYENDALIKYARTTTTPLIWGGDLFSDSKDLKEGAHSFGIEHGWSQATRSNTGLSMLTLARPSEKLSTSEMNIKMAGLMWLTQAFNTAIEELINTASVQDLNILLTSRESEVLRWTADGKTSYEVSIILSISERTVNFHLNNCMSKLSVNNKIAAVVKAISMGLI